MRFGNEPVTEGAEAFYKQQSDILRNKLDEIKRDLSLKKRVKPQIFVITGAPAVGKTTVQKFIVNNMPNFCSPVSYTTREPRDDEEEGVDYFFVSNPEFDVFSKGQLFCDETFYAGNRYGLMTEDLLEPLMMNKSVVVVMDQNGVKNLLESNEIDSDIIHTLHITFDAIENIRERLWRRSTKKGLVPDPARVQIAKEDQFPSYYADYIFLNREGMFDRMLERIAATIEDILHRETWK